MQTTSFFRTLMLSLLSLVASSVWALDVDHLQVLQLKNPIGIDKAPAFSWVLQSQEYGVRQESYKIELSTEADFSSIVWESGEVESDQSVLVAPTLSLQPSTRYFWRVTVKDNKGNTATSTEDAYFETGLMQTGWNDAHWIRKTSNPVGWVDEATISDYTIEADFEIEQIAAGLCFGVQNTQNYYMWQFNIENTNPRFRPHRWANGAASCLQDVDLTGKFDLKAKQVYHVRIEITDDGTRAMTYLDDVLIDNRRGDFPYGRLGMRASKAERSETGEYSYWDNLVMRVEGQETFREDFEGATHQFEGGQVVNGRLYLKGWNNPDVYAWQKVAETPQQSAAKHYILESEQTIVTGNGGTIFAYEGGSKYFMWAINTKDATTPYLRRHVYNGGNPVTQDIPLRDFTKAEILNAPHLVTYEVDGKKVYTYIDDILVDTYTHSTDVADGIVGFRFHGDDGGPYYVDNVRLTKFDADGNAKTVITEDFEGASYVFDGNVQYVNGSHQLVLSGAGETHVLDNTAGNAESYRRLFTPKGAVKAAKLYTSALGCYDLFVNGQRVGHLQSDGTTIYDELKPGWTDFDKKIFYVTNDITSLLKDGENNLTAVVTTGYWAGGISKGQYGFKSQAFRAKLLLQYEDGTEEVIVTDNSWQATNQQAVRMGDIYNGETYDARYNSAEAQASAEWYAVAYSRDFTGEISAFEGPAARVRQHLTRQPQTINLYEGVTKTNTQYGMLTSIGTVTPGQPISLKKGQTCMIDFGQNMVGWVYFTVKGQAGAKMRVRFSEVINETGDPNRGEDGPGGSPYLIALRGAKATLNYTLAGLEEGESYRPAHTYFGFRYAELTASADITIEQIVGEVMGAENFEESKIQTSHSAVNQLISNALWGQRGNFMSVPTDCPQRDERLGWTGDTQVFCRTAMYNANSAGFYHKFMGDMRDSQAADGGFPGVAPICWGVQTGQTGWADCGIILPWTTYMMYGDKSIIRENWDAMQKYMNYNAAQQFDGYLYNGPGLTWGDWLAFVNTDTRYLAVCYYAYDAILMARMARALSEAPGDEYALEALKYDELYENIKAEFISRYTALSSGIPTQSTQTAYLYALKLNLLKDEAAFDATVQRLERNITQRKEMLSTGFLGTAIINPTLTEVGLNDKAYNLLLQRECPSWLYSVDQGATTIWERWNSYTKEGGISKDIGMNSFNHYSYGAVVEWMYRFMAGIEADEQQPGFKHIVLRPYPDTRAEFPAGQERITSVDATFASPYGHVRSAWTMADDLRLVYTVSIPSNTTATVYLPLVADDDKVVVESALGEEIEPVAVEDGRAQFELVSGEYKFTVSNASPVNSVLSDNAASPEYYLVNGIRIQTPPARGLYIERRGQQAQARVK